MGVIEEDISGWIATGSDPYALGSCRAVYKCAFQFVERIRLARVLLGDMDPKEKETLQSMIQLPGLNFMC